MSNLGTLNIEVLGGTIAAEEQLLPVKRWDHSGKIVESKELVTQPKHGKVEELLHHQVTGQEIYRNVVATEAQVFIDSSDANCDTLEQAVNVVRKCVRETSGNILVCYGTDGAAIFAQALAEGIAPDMLEDRSILVAVAQYAAPPRPANARGAIEQNNTDAAKNLTHGIYISAREEMRGRIALLTDGRVDRARGLRKIVTEGYNPFLARYDAVVQADKGVMYKWGDFNTKMNMDKPAGTSDRFKLLPGVETLCLDGISDYDNLIAMVEGGIAKKTLKGLVLQAPGSRNLRDNKEDIDKVHTAVGIASVNGVPVAVVSDPMQPHRPNAKAAVYHGNASFLGGQLVEADGLQPAETRVVMSQALYTAHKHLHLEGEAVIEYIRERLRAYIAFINETINLQEYQKRKSISH